MSNFSSSTSLIAEADKCVLCGMCLPHCPTYTLKQTENESPRGRLMLGKALLGKQLEADDSVREHIDHCLLCRSCERVCPSGVKFGAFIDGLRAHLSQPATTPGPTDEIIDIVADPDKRRQFNQRLWLAQRSGLSDVGKLFLNASTNRMLEKLPRMHRYHPPQQAYTARDEVASVMLFTGCSEELFGNTLTKTVINFLNALGVTVHIPANQTCCGGVARHHGDSNRAEQLSSQNMAAFSSDETLPILSLASGCGTSLIDSSVSKKRVVDISQYVLEHIQQHGAKFKALSSRIALHTPCSLKNVLRQDSAVIELLARIPELECVPLNSQRGCCGAAGTYMYEQPEMADELREPLLEEIASQKVDTLLTSNIGCAMHIQSGLKKKGIKLQVIHPVELLAQQLLPG